MSNVRDFGAAGDGEQDDTDAILHAWPRAMACSSFRPAII